MMSTIILKRKFLNKKSLPDTKKDVVVTSTPIKKNTVPLLEMEWLSPVEKKSNEFPSSHVPTTSDPGKTSSEKLIDIPENEILKKTDTATGRDSVDKIHPVNEFLKPSDAQEVSTSHNTDNEPKSKEVKLIVMDSDEEEKFWQNRNKPIKKRKNLRNYDNESITDSLPLPKRQKKQEKIKTTTNVPTTEEAVTIDSQNHGILPKISVNSSKAVSSSGKTIKPVSPLVPLPAQKNKETSSKSALKVLKNLIADNSSDDSERQGIIAKPLKRSFKKISKDNENTVRRSNRKRSKPLEFWNGEKLEISKDFPTGIEEVIRNKKNLKQRKAKTVRGLEIELESRGLEQGNKITENTGDSEITHKPAKTSLTKRNEGNKRRKSILKSKINAKSKTNVRFSAIGTGTTIDGPTSKRPIKPEWVINFPGIQPRGQLLPDSENCVVLPGLNTAMGIISTAVMQMRPNAINKSRASDLHHLIFCVMVGTVTVTIDETSVRMKTYGHFAVPCGVAYSIENIGKRKAILSFFKVACSCISK